MSIYSTNICPSVCPSGYRRNRCKICYNCWKVSWFLNFFCKSFSTLPFIFLLILKSFATYGCRHPCSLINTNLLLSLIRKSNSRQCPLSPRRTANFLSFLKMNFVKWKRKKQLGLLLWPGRIDLYIPWILEWWTTKI